MYLTVEAIRATLATIATCAPGTRIVLTYNQPLSALHGIGLELDKAIRAFATEAGEPFLSLFVPKEIEALLTEMGFAEIMHYGPDEAIRTYFAGRSGVRFGGLFRSSERSIHIAGIRNSACTGQILDPHTALHY